MSKEQNIKKSLKEFKKAYGRYPDQVVMNIIEKYYDVIMAMPYEQLENGILNGVR